MKIALMALLMASFSTKMVAKPLKIIALGDSLTAGYGISQDDAWPKLLQDRLRKSGWPKAEVVNSGISGSTSASLTGRLDWVLKGKPTHVILAIGPNDGLRGNIDATEQYISTAIKKVKEAKAMPLLVEMQIPPNYGKAFTKKFKELYPQLVKKHQIKSLGFLLKGVGGEPKYNLPDGIHPNEDGHKVIAKNLFEQIRPLLHKGTP